MNKFLITSDSSFFPELDIISHSRFEMLYLFFRSSKFSLYLITKFQPIIARFHLVFLTSLSFYHPFITGFLHGGSTWWFVKVSFHSRFVLQDFYRSYDMPSYTLK